MKILARILILSALLALSANLFPGTALAAGKPVVHAVLFYSPSCPHCHKVMSEDIPPLTEKYGNQLLIIGVNVGATAGQALYRTTVQHFAIPEDRQGVPTLVVGETVLVGSNEIPEQFPGLIEAGLKAGGVPWPAIPGLEEVLVDQGITEPAEATLAEKFALDPAGNSLSVIVLLGMLASLAYAGYRALSGRPVEQSRMPAWIIPALIAAGIAIAAYLSYIEITKTEAVCGPVGDCNTVQQSEYSRLFGLLPVGVVGLTGYLSLLLAWLVQRFGPAGWRSPAALAQLGLAVTGVLFMVYLTFLEPFVIGATCAWCLTTAVILTLIMLASTAGGIIAWRALKNQAPETELNPAV